MLHPSAKGPTVKVGIIRSSSIGDVVLATICLDLLSQMSTSVEVTWIGRSPALGLIKNAYPDIALIDLAKHPKNSQLVHELSHLHFLVDLQANVRSLLICRSFKKTYNRPYFSSEKRRLHRTLMVMEARIRGRSNKQPKPRIGDAKTQRQLMVETLWDGLQQHLPQERLDDLAPSAARPRLPIAHRDVDNRTSWHKELDIGVWLGIACGASYPTKIAPLGLMAKIVNETRRKLAKPDSSGPPFGIVLLGDHADRATSQKLLDDLCWTDPMLNLTGQLSLWESAVALSCTSAVLSNDSGLSHIAEAVGTPVSVLFGPTSEAFGFSPWKPNSAAFSGQLGCRPCSKHGKAPCRYSDRLCFEMIRDADVASHLARLLSQPRPKEKS